MPNGREKKVNALFVEFLIPDIGNRFFILFGRFLSRGINHPPMYHIIYRMKNHSTCFRSFPLFVSVVFTLTMSISRDYHRDCISHDTHSSHSSSLSGTLGTKKKSLLENKIEGNGFIFVLRSNVCAYLHCVVIIVLFSLFFYNDVLSCLV